MAVTFTPNIGLAKPTESELALEWARNTKLAEDNNILIAANMDLPLNSYNPIFNANTVTPNVGAGSVRGEYQDIQGMIFGSFIVEFISPGIASGSGEWVISLPLVADNVFHTIGGAFNTAGGFQSIIGDGYIYNSASTASVSAALDVVTVAGVSYVRFLTEAHTLPAKTLRIAQPGQPLTPATLDKFVGNFIYKKL